ncbi:AraC family transcriptional regulator, partial [Salmonella enterica subsp. enterica serovar Dublin]|nr:AraC family transcriptional regulator [Salmonella enterica subsp. enterica serovar Dublin]
MYQRCFDSASHSCPVVSVVQGKEVIKSIFNELSV